MLGCCPCQSLPFPIHCLLFAFPLLVLLPVPLPFHRSPRWWPMCPIFWPSKRSATDIGWFPEWSKTAKSGSRSRIPRGGPRGIPRLLDFPGHSPGTWPAQSISREIPPGSRTRNPSSREIYQGNFPGCGVSREISREVGRGIRLPGEVPGESVAPDFGFSPCVLIATKSGISARRRRPGGPHPQVLTRLDAIPDSPRVGAGVSGPRERLCPRYLNSADCARRFSRN